MSAQQADAQRNGSAVWRRSDVYPADPQIHRAGTWHRCTPLDVPCTSSGGMPNALLSFRPRSGVESVATPVSLCHWDLRLKVEQSRGEDTTRLGKKLDISRD